MKNLSQISVILMKNLSHFGHLRLAGMCHPLSPCTLKLYEGCGEIDVVHPVTTSGVKAIIVKILLYLLKCIRLR